MLYILVLAAAVFTYLASLYEQFPGDESMILWVRGLQDPAMTVLMDIASWVGSGWLLFGLVGIVAVALLRRRRRREGLAALGVLAIMSFSPLLKLLVDRPRPPVEVTSLGEALGGLGFPSGHAYQSIIVFGLLILVAGQLVSRVWLRRIVQALLVMLIGSVGLSRVYLGVHWPSDVLGAYLLGGAVLALLLRGYKARAVAQASR
jgi:undecaprenyl-diphosphatase